MLPLPNIIANIRAMMLHRGYRCISYKDPPKSFKEHPPVLLSATCSSENRFARDTANDRFPQTQNAQTQKNGDERNEPYTTVRVLVFLFATQQLNIDRFKAVSAYVERANVHRLVLIAMNSTNTVRSTVEVFRIPTELFAVTFFKFNLMAHSFVYIHERVAHWDTNLHNLPLLCTSDPVARYMGFTVGDVVRIRRPTQTYYRYVVKGKE